MTLTLCVKKRRRKRTYQHWRQRWPIDTTTRRLLKKTCRKTDYNNKKPYWRHEDQENRNNQKKREEKQLYGRFQWPTSDISHEKTWTWLRKGNLKRETDFLLIAVQNNAMSTNYIKARIDKTQQNSKCRLCGGQRWNDQSYNKRMQQISKERV